MTSACRAGISLETQGKIMESGTVWTDSKVYLLRTGSQAALNIYLHLVTVTSLLSCPRA